MTLFFTSDTHFGHAGARSFYARPFASVADMDRALVERWNDTVGADDAVWHLGDFALGPKPERVAELLAALNGTKHLIAGNNDNATTRGLPGWSSVAEFREIEANGRLLVLCHYPLRSWNGMAKGSLDLHGHSHGRMKPMTRQVDVGVDVWDFRPVALERLTASRRQA
jgi:calcineurin-like phosphoesterase family protein